MENETICKYYLVLVQNLEEIIINEGYKRPKPCYPPTYHYCPFNSGGNYNSDGFLWFGGGIRLGLNTKVRLEKIFFDAVLRGILYNADEYIII